MKISVLIELMQIAFDAGFDASGEGCNAEHATPAKLASVDRERDRVIGYLLGEAVKRGVFE